MRKIIIKLLKEKGHYLVAFYSYTSDSGFQVYDFYVLPKGYDLGDGKVKHFVESYPKGSHSGREYVIKRLTGEFEKL